MEVVLDFFVPFIIIFVMLYALVHLGLSSTTPFARKIRKALRTGLGLVFTFGRLSPYTVDRKTGGESIMEDKDEFITPEILDEQQVKKDLAFYKKRGRKSLNSYLAHLAERFKTEQETKTLQKWTEQLNMKKEFMKAATEAKRSKSEFYRVDTESEMEKEKLKTMRLEHQYKQKELQQKLENLKLEDEYKRLELQRKIEDLKKIPKTTESKIERLKKDQLEKIDFQEEIRKVKTMRLADRIEHLYKLKKEWRQKYPSEEAEEIIDEFDRIMVEEGLKEE